jgi:hypothetical protein
VAEDTAIPFDESDFERAEKHKEHMDAWPVF